MEEQKEAVQETADSGKGISAKSVSLWAKIIGIVIIVAAAALKWVKVLDADVNDIIKVGLSVVALCSTVDINIMVDKFTKK